MNPSIANTEAGPSSPARERIIERAPVRGFADLQHYRLLADRLTEVGYTHEGLARAINMDESAVPRPEAMPSLMRRTRGGQPLDTLVRLFLFGVPVPRAVAETALHPLPLEAAISAGLIVSVEADCVRSEAKIIPFRNLFLAFDASWRRKTQVIEDWVMGVGSSTQTLANLVVRDPRKCVLDFGTGCGVHALLASAHAEHVTGLDCNPRALAYARFNQQLNGRTGIEWLEGSSMQAVAGRQFDLIVANPPYVISPARQLVFRDNGEEGHGFCRRLAREAVGYLRPGGMLQMLANWVQPTEGPWHGAPAEWFAGLDCDVWVMRSHEWEAAQYATMWLSETEFLTPDMVERFEEWMTYFERVNITHIAGGTIVVRKSARFRPWVRTEQAPDRMLGPCGNDVLRGFALQDFLEDASPEQIGQTRFVLSPKVRLKQTFVPEQPGAWRGLTAELQLATGFAFSGQTDAYMAGLLARCDGRQTLGELSVGLSDALKRPVAEVIDSVLDIIRPLIAKGFLLPIHLVPPPDTISKDGEA